ncbi:hypothetical protein RGUI_1597 [Rhodovulum sp. P5]|uniref:histidine phosphatase family protein n=1 Tax=Rhodovulum sp. P5 TaxID=1564506 RepID=UPI0009C30FD0|nr:histidine phosphatase family protein [Rhodovulum sp. P5]ARE39738.1 hypothetical protein RGUI_1597 [Rhodovulum sp. P5]
MAEPAGFVALLRHGAYHQRAGAPSARQPYPLTEEGHAQARAGGAALAAMIAEADLQPDPVIHCSHQLRAWQTATEVADCLRAHGHSVAEIRETGALAERGLGCAANLTVNEIEAILSADPRHDPPPAGWKSNSQYQLPLEGAESLMQAGARVARYLRETVANPGPARRVTIFVGHGASFRHAACHLGLLSEAQLAGLSMHHARPLLFCYSRHGSWRHFEGAWKVRASGDAVLD